MEFVRTGLIGFLLFNITALSSLASNKVGNGGNVIVCRKARSVQLLDFYEATPKIRLLKPNVTSEEKVAEEALRKIEKVAPKLYVQYSKRLKSIMSEIEFRKDIELTSIPDSKHFFKPADSSCEVKQIAIRKKLTLKDEFKFIVNQGLWNELDKVHRGGLLLHEIIYEHFANLGEEDSIKARRVNVFLFDTEKRAADFWPLIEELKLPIYP